MIQRITSSFDSTEFRLHMQSDKNQSNQTCLQIKTRSFAWIHNCQMSLAARPPALGALRRDLGADLRGACESHLQKSAVLNWLEVT